MEKKALSQDFAPCANIMVHHTTKNTVIYTERSNCYLYSQDSYLPRTLLMLNDTFARYHLGHNMLESSRWMFLIPGSLFLALATFVQHSGWQAVEQ